MQRHADSAIEMSAIRNLETGWTGAATQPAADAAERPHALIFDSGVGGLSVLKEVAALLPGIQISYAADNAGYPYGGKPEDELVDRVTAVLRLLAERTRPDVVVIACNTASTRALDAVREMLPIQVVGVVPAIKPAAQFTKTGTIGLLGTNGTVGSAYTRSLIEQFAAGRTVIRCGAPELVEAAERKMQGEAPDPAMIASVLDRMLGSPGGEAIDVVVLGCTHFPLLVPELDRGAGRTITWMDSGAAIARRVATILKTDEKLIPPAPPRPDYRAIFTAESAAIDRMRPALAGLGFSEVEFLPV